MAISRGSSLLDDPGVWQRLKDILANALEEPTREARLASIHKACGDDLELSRSAEELLGCDTQNFEEFADLLKSHLQRDEHNRAGERLGAYVILSEIDRGGMGAVYLAERADGHFEKQVAIKVIKRGTDTDEALRRFHREGQILAQLDHPNITRLLDAGATADGLPYFVMEYVRGTPITRYAREKKLDLRARVEIFVKVCRAVATAHRNHTIHRDIKPGNVLVRDDGEPKLLDFGIAKLIAPERAEADFTQPRKAHLTSSYASPEQIAGQEATVASDVYSLGALLSELITEKRPSAEPARTAAPAGEHALGQIIDRAMQSEPALRYASAQELADDLERYLHGDSPVGRTFRQPKRAILPWAIAAAIALVVLIGSGAAYLWRAPVGQNRKTSAPPPAAVSHFIEPIRSIAVLPFEPLGDEEDNQLLGLGMADAVIGRICALPDVSVLPTAAVLRYKGSTQDGLAAGLALNVDAVLSGTVQRAENRVRVTVQLINVKDRRPLWAQKFDETFTDIFAMQDSISEKVARSIKSNLRARDVERLSVHHTVNPAAYRAYLAGLSFYVQRTQSAFPKAIEHFRDAIDLDQNYALAYALMSDCYSLQYYYHYAQTPEVLKSGRTTAERALLLDDSLPEAHLALAMAQTNAGEVEPAVKSLERALELNPNLAIARLRYAWELTKAGRLQEGVEQMRRAQELDPLFGTSSTALGVILIFARDYPGALYFCQRAAELNPNEPFIQSNVGMTYQLNNRFDEAIEAYHRMAKIDPAFEGDALASIAIVQLESGRRSEAEETLPKILRLASEGKVDPYNLVLYFTESGDHDRAFEWLATAFEKAHAPAAMIRYDPLLDPLRSDPRFAETLGKFRSGNLLNSAKR